MKDRVNLRIDADLKRTLEEMSAKMGVSLSSLVEKLIARALTHPRGEYIIKRCGGCGKKVLIDGKTLEEVKRRIRGKFYCVSCAMNITH